MFKLIRDNIPEIIKEKGELCNFAQVQNPELMAGVLREKMVEEVNEFLQANPTSDESLQELVDIVTVVRAIYTAGGLDDEEFEKLYQEKLKTRGGFDKGYIMFLPDPVEQGQVENDQ